MIICCLYIKQTSLNQIYFKNVSTNKMFKFLYTYIQIVCIYTYITYTCIRMARVCIHDSINVNSKSNKNFSDRIQMFNYSHRTIETNGLLKIFFNSIYIMVIQVHIDLKIYWHIYIIQLKKLKILKWEHFTHIKCSSIIRRSENIEREF